jgi:hypothetical protein
MLRMLGKPISFYSKGRSNRGLRSRNVGLPVRPGLRVEPLQALLQGRVEQEQHPHKLNCRTAKNSSRFGNIFQPFLFLYFLNPLMVLLLILQPLLFKCLVRRFLFSNKHYFFCVNSF